MVGSRCKIGTDGKTPYERLKGRRCTMVAIPVGERVWYKQLKDEEEAEEDTEWNPTGWKVCG